MFFYFIFSLFMLTYKMFFILGINPLSVLLLENISTNLLKEFRTLYLRVLPWKNIPLLSLSHLGFLIPVPKTLSILRVPSTGFLGALSGTYK